MKNILLLFILLGITSANAEFKKDPKVTNPAVEIPDKIELSQNYPNPFNPSTTIKFKIEKEEFVTLKLYNIIGQEVKSVISEMLPGGEHTIEVNCNDLSGGIYFYTLKAGSNSQTKRMTLLK